MTNATPTKAPLGRLLEDGREVFLSPENGPLLVIGRSGIGKSLLLKKLLKRTAESGAGPIFAYDEAAASRYGEVVRAVNERGGSEDLGHLVLVPGAEAPLGSAGFGGVVVSDGLGFGSREQRLRLLGELLDRRVLRGSPLPHLFLDGIDDLVGPEDAVGASVEWHWRHSRSMGLLAVAGARDLRHVLRPGARGRVLVELARSFVLFGTYGEDVRRLVELLDPPPTARARMEPERLRRLGTGCGILYDRTTRTARDVEVDLAEGELDLFDTRPPRKRGDGVAEGGEQ